MIEYLLDSNAVIGIITGRTPLIVERVAGSVRGSIALSSIVLHELFFGAYHSARTEDNLATLRNLLPNFETIDFNSDDAWEAGEIRAALKRIGQPIGPLDVLIAGQARGRGLILVTNNTREFNRVEGLRVEDWSQP